MLLLRLYLSGECWVSGRIKLGMCSPSPLPDIRPIYIPAFTMPGNSGRIHYVITKYGQQQLHRAYNVIFGLFQAPYYAFSQTMMAELTPPGFDNMVRLYSFFVTQIYRPTFSSYSQFFGLFGLSNRASSMIGPNVIQAIIDKSGSNWMGFPFLFALCFCASLVIWCCVDVEKGRTDAVAWADGIRKKSEALEDMKVMSECL